MIEVADFNLRGGRDAPRAAAKVARVTERYLPESGAREVTAVASELVDCVGRGDPAPSTLRLELAVTDNLVRISVTAALRTEQPELTSNQALRRTLPVTSSVASRYGVEHEHRLRLWAEFDRPAPLAAYAVGRYSW